MLYSRQASPFLAAVTGPMLGALASWATGRIRAVAERDPKPNASAAVFRY
jgi:hypothetical protein